jgi:NTP pyrophosphatase (non-canonical NTP hydrolase)
MIDSIKTLNDYQKAAVNFLTKGTSDNTLFLGLASETGEVLDEFLKEERLDKKYEDTTEELILELGDVLFYIAAIAKRRGYSLQQVALKNFLKLREREIQKSIEEVKP